MPDCRYLVADRDRRNHDQSDAGRDGGEARIGDVCAAGNRGRRRHPRRPQRRRQRGRAADRAQAVAGDAADYLPRPRALQEQLLFANRRRLPYRRRRAARPDGYLWIMGRVDDVIKVSGHRLGTMEIESALVSHAGVAEAACVGRPDDVKGEAVVAFVTLEGGHHGNDKLRDELRAHVVKEIGALARPEDIRFTDALPKTRSGKNMRRLLRQIASGDQTLGDTTTLEDLS